MKNAFTLAEVLIMLGIIGVVAALTVPSLITNHQKKQTVVQLRKVYSDLHNAVELSEVSNGPMQDWRFPSCASYNYECIEPFLTQYWIPYFQGAHVYSKSEFNNQGYYIFGDYAKNNLNRDSAIITHYITLNNGVILSFFSNTNNGYIWLFADINGAKGPNRIGRDIFVFDAYHFEDFDGGDYQRRHTTYELKFWGQYFENSTDLTLTFGYGCSKNNTTQYRNFHCGRLIELNNWEIPKDYPW